MCFKFPESKPSLIVFYSGQLGQMKYQDIFQAKIWVHLFAPTTPPGKQMNPWVKHPLFWAFPSLTIAPRVVLSRYIKGQHPIIISTTSYLVFANAHYQHLRHLGKVTEKQAKASTKKSAWRKVRQRIVLGPLTSQKSFQTKYFCLKQRLG